MRWIRLIMSVLVVVFLFSVVIYEFGRPGGAFDRNMDELQGRTTEYSDIGYYRWYHEIGTLREK